MSTLSDWNYLKALDAAQDKKHAVFKVLIGAMARLSKAYESNDAAEILASLNNLSRNARYVATGEMPRSYDFGCMEELMAAYEANAKAQFDIQAEINERILLERITAVQKQMDVARQEMERILRMRSETIGLVDAKTTADVEAWMRGEARKP